VSTANHRPPVGTQAFVARSSQLESADKPLRSRRVWDLVLLPCGCTFQTSFTKTGGAMRGEIENRKPNVFEIENLTPKEKEK
jgi:hypothetical protein